ncbi:hypothetical protein [Rhodococcus sp. B10]|uniref:hypothetical protein n=1 Tax=Rhodococcus sp. B10 TaxID=2695876 RepID=UPI00143229A7|nr:hypothetical protein [Rhodococcus sp. B10]NIL77649.1 hypothetical protein [Rhodococcus sp. B10]
MSIWNQQPLQQNMETEQMESAGRRARAPRRAQLTTELKLEARDNITLADLDEIMAQTANWDRNTIVTVKAKTYDQRGEMPMYTLSLIEGRTA